LAVTMLDSYKLSGNIRLTGEAPFVRLNFGNDDIAALFRREMINSGTLIIASHNVCAALGKPELKRIAKSYDHACGVVAEAIKNGDIIERLAGGSIVKGVR